jgi:hypothetical protein
MLELKQYVWVTLGGDCEHNYSLLLQALVSTVTCSLANAWNGFQRQTFPLLWVSKMPQPPAPNSSSSHQQPQQFCNWNCSPANSLHWLTVKNQSKICREGRSVGQPVLVWRLILGPKPDLWYSGSAAGFSDEDGAVIYNCCWSLLAQSFSAASPTGLKTIFYALSFETPTVITPQALGSLRVSSYYSQGCGGGVRTLFCKEASLCPKSKSHYDRWSVGQFVLVSCPFWSRWPDVTFIWVKITFFIFLVWRPLWREDGSIICSTMTQVQFQVTLRPTVCRPVRRGAGPPMGPITRF